MSNIFFFIFLLIALFIFYYADKKNDKKLLIIGIIIVSFVSGFRGQTVGIDTSAYYDAFINNFPKSWQFEEIGFRLISNLLMLIFHNASIIILIYALITNLLIFMRLWDYRKKCSFIVMSLLYILIFFVDSMNIMRQFLALSIVFYGTKYIDNKKYFLYTLFVIFATCLHKSSIMALLLIIIDIWDNLSDKKKKFVMVLTLFASIFIFIFERDHIFNYFSTRNMVNNINLTYLYRFSIFFVPLFTIIKNNKIVFKEQKRLVRTKLFKKITIIYFCGLLFCSMGMIFNLMQRVGYIFLIYELIYWGYIARKLKERNYYISLIFIYAFYVFALEIIRNGSGVFPYYFCF